MPMVKISPTALNFGYDFVLLVHFLGHAVFPRSNWQQILLDSESNGSPICRFHNGLDCVMEPLLLETRCEISDTPLTSDTHIVEKYQKMGRKQTDDFFGFALFFM